MVTKLASSFLIEYSPFSQVTKKTVYFISKGFDFGKDRIIPFGVI